MGQIISVDIEQFSTSVSEELINRYLPPLILSVALLLFTVYIANSLVKRKN
jgi:NADH:ubiquinone oxidoreductase subunit 6 (subunit J)